MQKQRETKGRNARARCSSTASAASPSTSPRRIDNPYAPQPELQLIYDTAPVGLAFLSPDCRYVLINERLTEICGVSPDDHIGRSVRETVPQVADQVEQIVQAIVRSGESITGVEVHGQRADKLNADHVWITNWHPLKGPKGNVVGINVVAEDVTEQKRTEMALAAREKALRESEARFRELADNMSQFAWTADETGWIYWYNKRWHDYTGTTLEEMQGWGWRKVHHPDHVEGVVQRIKRSFESGTPWEDTFPLRGRDGSYRWFLSRALPIRNDAGNVVRWFGTNTDVTDQIEAETALRELNETLEQRVEAETRERLQIWNVSQDLLAVTNLEGTYLSVNPAWTATLGWSESEMLGKSSEWLLDPDDRGRPPTGQRTLQFENRFRHKNGGYRWISWRSVPDRGRIYVMGRDITELKDAETQLRLARRELAQGARRTTAAVMTAAIAHEVRQPLAAIVANANAVLHWLNRPQPDLDEACHTLKNIVRDGHRASAVVESVRGIFSGDNQARTLINTNELVRNTIALLHSDLEAAGIVVDLELLPELPQVYGHRGQLQQIILNIITNSADAMRTISSRTRLLQVKSAIVDPNRIMLSFEDSGSGIDSKNLERIFDPFFTTKPQGMGMGLAICRSIVEAHGGKMAVSPGSPHGSVFQISLPLEKQTGQI
jgi:PAS domain S-box-containing protein